MKKYLIISILICALMISACKTGSNAETPSETVFRGGTQGLVATFEPFGVEEGGVYTIFDTERFPIAIELKNKGEQDIEKGDVKVSLKGISVNDFEGLGTSEKTNDGIIEKVSEFNQLGGETRIDFTPGADARYKLDVIGFLPIDVFAVFEYEYQTHVVVPKACFKEDLRDTRICEVEETKDYYVSGAPITVTSVTEDSAGRGLVALTFEVSNNGGGRATVPKGDFDARYDKISYKIDEPEKWECKAGGLENEARLVDGKASIRCKLINPLEADALYTRQVGLTLEYKYQDVIQQTLKIKESSED